MAYAVRAVSLGSEEAADHGPVKIQGRRKRSWLAVWGRPLLAVAVVAGLVTLATAHISSYARLARYELERQSLEEALAQLKRDSVQLNLALDRLTAQPYVLQAAGAQGLALPTPEREVFVRVSDPLPAAVAARPAPETGRAPWVARAGQRFVAVLDSILQRLSPVGSKPAYAQE